MNCKEADKYIHLYQDDEISSVELSKLQEHLKSCPDCSKIHSNLATLTNISVQLKSNEPGPVNLDSFTESIMNQIETRPAKKILFIQHPVFRVAALLIISLSLFSLLNQNRLINEQIQALNTTQTEKANNMLMTNYNSCIVQSKLLVAQIARSDEELTNLLISNATGSINSEVTMYAGKICRNTIDIETLSNQEKKELILQVLKGRRNVSFK